MNTKSISELAILWQASEKNPKIRLETENILEKKINENRNFSREYIFDQSFISKKSITFTFIPTTKSYKEYGETIVVDVAYTQEEIENFLQNIRDKTNTFGTIRGKCLFTEDLSEHQISEILTTGFETKEILSIQ